MWSERLQKTGRGSPNDNECQQDTLQRPVRQSGSVQDVAVWCVYITGCVGCECQLCRRAEWELGEALRKAEKTEEWRTVAARSSFPSKGWKDRRMENSGCPIILPFERLKIERNGEQWLPDHPWCPNGQLDYGISPQRSTRLRDINGQLD